MVPLGSRSLPTASTRTWSAVVVWSWWTPLPGAAAAPIAVGSAPQQVAIAPDVKHAYVTGGSGSPTLSVIDTKTGAVTGTIPVGSVPMGVAVCSARNTTR